MGRPSLLRPSLALAALAIGVYLNTLPAQFTFDDNFAVISNGDVSDPNKPLLALFKNDFWGQDLDSEMSHKSYRPFTVLSFRIQRAVGQFFFAGRRARYVEAVEKAGGHDNSRGIDPLLFHASNVAAHAAVTVLVFRLALRLIASRHRQCGQRAPWGAQDLTEALVAALLFAVHPVHTEAVAGIVGHAEMLCASLSILALLSYMAAADGRVSSLAAHWQHVGLAVVLGWAAALTKEIGITIMGAMACYDLLLSPLCISFGPGAAAAAAAAKPAPGKQHKNKPTAAAAAAARTTDAAAVGQAGGGGSSRQGLGLKFLRLLATAVGVLVYVKARSLLAGDQLVRIYRKTENPIPFSDSSLERKLTTGYLHARYAGLLVAPVQLSADWSYACIDYVSSLADPRNAATLALYLFLVFVLLAARPWRVLAQWAGKLPAEASPTEQVQRWRLMVVTGLLVAPYFPASNVLFYVGTFIGERLLYFPSVGFCLLVAEWLAPALLPLAEAYREDGGKGVQRAWPGFGRKTKLVAVALGAVLTLFTLKTLHRNADWYDEERLFRAAQKVCWRSAKVQLNSGILERRYQHWDKAIDHFKLAHEVDNTFCEPDYHIGVSLVSKGTNLPLALDYLEKGIGCKYTAAEAVKALNQVFAALLQNGAAGSAAGTIGLRWAKILSDPHLRRYSEALHYCEQAAMMYAKAGQQPLTSSTLDTCREMLSTAEPDLVGRTSAFPIRVKAPPELLATLKKCLKARAKVVSAVADAPGATEDARLSSPAAKAAAYRYFSKASPLCRQPLPVVDAEPGSAEQQQRGGSFHMELLHALQKADPNDPWIQHEWAETMVAQGRAGESLLYFEVAGQLLRQQLAELVHGKETKWTDLEGRPLSIEAAREGALGALRRGMEVASDPDVAGSVRSKDGQPVRVDCVMQVDICTIYEVLSSAPADTSGLSPTAIQGYAADLSRCIREAQRMNCPLGAQPHGGQQQEADEEEAPEGVEVVGADIADEDVEVVFEPLPGAGHGAEL